MVFPEGMASHQGDLSKGVLLYCILLDCNIYSDGESEKKDFTR